MPATRSSIRAMYTFDALDADDERRQIHAPAYSEAESKAIAMRLSRDPRHPRVLVEIWETRRGETDRTGFATFVNGYLEDVG